MAVFKEVKIISIKGGPGSGNFGHEGRPGHEGGSAADTSSGGKTVGAADKPKHAKKVVKLSPKSQQHLEDEKRRDARKKRDEARKLQNDMAEAARSRDAIGFTHAQAKLANLNDKSTPAQEARFLGGKLSKASIIDAFKGIGADKLDIKQQITQNKAAPTHLAFVAGMHRRPGRSDEVYDYSLRAEFYEDGNVKLYPTGMQMPTKWKNGEWKSVGLQFAKQLQGHGFTSISLPIPDDSPQGSSYKRYKL